VIKNRDKMMKMQQPLSSPSARAFYRVGDAKVPILKVSRNDPAIKMLRKRKRKRKRLRAAMKRFRERYFLARDSRSLFLILRDSAPMHRTIFHSPGRCTNGSISPVREYPCVSRINAVKA